MLKLIALGILLLAGMPLGSAWADEELNKKLFAAVNSGDKVEIGVLIAKGANVNAKDGYDYTPLHKVAWEGKTEVAAFLLSKGADVNGKGPVGWTPLHMAASGGRKEVAELLVSKGANVDAKQDYGETPLHSAAYGSQTEVAAFLISKGAVVNAKCNVGRTPLHRAAYEAKTEVAELLILKGANVNAKDEYGETPLQVAVASGNKVFADFLVSKGASIDAAKTVSVAEALNAALIDAAGNGDRAKVEDLIFKGAAVNAKDVHDWTPLHEAAHKGKMENTELLISKGAELNAKNKDGNTPLHLAAWGDRRDVAELLIFKGADVNAKNGFGDTPLHNSAYFGKKEIAYLLVSRLADVNAKNSGGYTPLHDAVKEGHKEIAELLISKGADINARTKISGELTPLQLTANIADTNARQEMIALVQGQVASQSNPRQLLKSLLEQFKGNPYSDELRKGIIEAALKVQPPPAIPQEAEDAAGRAAFVFSTAQSEEDLLATAKEYLKAIEMAPWVANYYYNLCIVLENSPYTKQALHACKLYRIAVPNAADAAETQQRIAGLQYVVDKSSERIKGRTANSGNLDMMYRFGGLSGQLAGKDVAIKLVVDWRASPPRYQLFASSIQGASVEGGAFDLVSTDTWITLFNAGFHLVIKPEGAGFVELGDGGGGTLRTTLDELFQRKQKALEQSLIYYVYGSDKDMRFYVDYLHGGRDDQYSGNAKYESDCNGFLLRQDPRAVPDDFLSLDARKQGSARFYVMKDDVAMAKTGCNFKFRVLTGYSFGDKE